MKLHDSALILAFLSIMGIMTAQENYIVTDTSLMINIKLVDGGAIRNARICEQIEENQSILYTPNDITEYGFANGTVYISKNILTGDSTRSVFLEQIEKGPNTLYYYRNEETEYYIIENIQGKSVQLPDKTPGQSVSGYREILAMYTSDCRNVADAVKLVTYNKKLMGLLTKRYNNCERKPFPFFKYGVFAGYVLSDLKYIAGVGNGFIVQENPFFKNAEFSYSGGVLFGAFIDMPISVSNFAFHPEISISNNEYSSQYELEEYFIEVTISTAAVNIPMLIRYYAPINKARPYLSVGAIYAYQFKDEFSSMTMPEFEGEYPAPVVTNQLGISAGIGCQFDITYRMRLYMDCRYNYLYGLKKSGQESYNKNEFQFTAGFSL